MQQDFIKYIHEQENPRIKRERKTMEVMIRIYCKGKHSDTGRHFNSIYTGSKIIKLCSECECLYHYACERLIACPIRDEKPSCKNCTIHCYKPDMKENIRTVMRYAGPRMFYRHPILSIMHFIDNRNDIDVVKVKAVESERIF